jgi:hypothetical protein
MLEVWQFVDRYAGFPGALVSGYPCDDSDYFWDPFNFTLDESESDPDSDSTSDYGHVGHWG